MNFIICIFTIIWTIKTFIKKVFKKIKVIKSNVCHICEKTSSILARLLQKVLLGAREL